MAITINPSVLPSSAPSAPAPGVVLPAGQVITAQVVQVLGSDQVQIAIGNQTIDAATQVPLQVGQTLQLQVSQTPSGIGLAIVNSPSGASAGQDAAGGTASASNAVVLAPSLAASVGANLTPNAITPVNPLTPLETLAVSVAAETAAAQQASLAPLFADLTAASALPNLPLPVQQAGAQVLAQQTNLDQNLTGDTIKQAFQSSGLFLEASLASGSAQSPTVVPDLKAALIVLRQALSTSLTSASTATDPVNLAAPTPQAPIPTPAPTLAPASPQASAPVDATTSNASTPEASADSVTTGSTSTVPSTAIAPEGTPVATTTAVQVEPSLAQAISPAVTILAEAASETPVSVLTSESPSLAPQPATATPSSATSATQSPQAAIASETPDLAVANQTLAPAAAAAADATARATTTSAALNLLQEIFQGTPIAAGSFASRFLQNGQLLSLLPLVIPARRPAIEDPEFARTNLPPPPINGALPTAQPVAPATLSARVPVEAALQHLLGQTDGAIARQTLLQIASLPGQTDPSATRIDLSTPRWNFEIPFATPQGTAVAQFEISRDGGGREVDAPKATWRARFTLNVEPAGPVHALISLNGERTSVRMWAERPATAAQLRAGVSQLTQALSRAELVPGDILIRDGAPVQPSPAPAGHFLDRAS